MTSITFTFCTSPRSHDDYIVYNGGRHVVSISDNLRKTLSTKLKQALEGNTLTWFAFNGFWNYFAVYSLDNRSKVLATEWSTLMKLPATAHCDKFLNENKDLSPRVVFGPGLTVLCWALQPSGNTGSPRTSAFWDATGPWADLDKALKNRQGLNTLPILNAALGVDGAYWVQFDDEGNEKMQLKSSYENLATYLKLNKDIKIAFLALHPQDENQYFMVYDKNNVRASLSSAIYNQVRSALNEDKKAGFIKNLTVVPSDGKSTL